jgi:dipeptide transport system permease protein
MRSTVSNFRLVAGLSVLLLIVAVALLAPVLAPQDPMEQSLFDQFLPPMWAESADPDHLLGTDNLGRDVLSRLIYGTQPALVVMVVGALLSGLLGSVLGALSGYFGGWIDAVVSRIVDIFMAFPPILVAIVLAAVLTPGLDTVVLAIMLSGWTRFCRAVRGEMLALRESDFVHSARIVGVRHWRILYHELVPNLVPLLSVLLALEMGRAIVVEALLSFIGFSSSGLATWGSMIADGRSYLNQAWWTVVLPIALIVVSVLGLNALGDGARQVVDPVMRK